MTSEVCQMFLNNMYLESEVEKLKLELARQTDFTCYEAFRVFDRNSISYFDLHDFTETMLKFVGSQGFERD